MRVRVTAPNTAWPAEYMAEAQRVREALAVGLAEIHHIGSTAIPGIAAKPIIDILLVATSLRFLEESAAAMEGLGYQVMGEFGIQGRRYFRKDSPEGIRTHQVHGFQVGSTEIIRHLAFRDFMRAHPIAAASYSRLKQQLATQHPDDFSAYMDGKDAFIKEHEAKALQWVVRGDA